MFIVYLIFVYITDGMLLWKEILRLLSDSQESSSQNKTLHDMIVCLCKLAHIRLSSAKVGPCKIFIYMYEIKFCYAQLTQLA